MSAGAGIQPHVVWGQNSGACGHALLLAPALVPGHPGSGISGDSVHHHHLHPEVTCFPGSCSRRWEQPLHGLLTSDLKDFVGTQQLANACAAVNNTSDTC